MTTLTINSKWPIEKIYLAHMMHYAFADGVPEFNIRSFERKYIYEYHPDFDAAVRSETDWKPTEPAPVLSYEIAVEVGLGRQSCPICLGHQTYHRLMHGETTDITIRAPFDCPCGIAQRYWRQIVKDVPPRFRDAILSTLLPSSLSRMPLERQAAIIQHLQGHPESSYFFWGDAGCSKTYFAVALFQHALAKAARHGWSTEKCPVVRVKAPALLQEWVRNSTDAAAPAPSYTPEMAEACERNGERPFLLLDEVDKFKGSDFKLNKLFEIVNAIYDNHGQIVATSNSSPQALLESWGTKYGDPILRRISQHPEGQTKHFQAG